MDHYAMDPRPATELDVDLLQQGMRICKWQRRT
jgi:hypothetical protein